jgi:PD-(D/E)XK nuclease superfamily protein
MARPTFSSLERSLRCPGWLALPHVNTTSPYAERGTAIHEYLEAIQGGADPAAALEAVPEEWRSICAAIDIDRLPKGLAAEVAFAYDVESGKARELGRSLGRNYTGLGPTEIAGTLDVVGVSEDAVYVLDWKTGWTDVPLPASNFQLRVGGLAAARAYRKGLAVLELGRIKENGAVWKPEPAELDDFDLDAFAAEVRPVLARVRAAQEQAFERGGDPDVTVGPWCKHCPAWQACPAQATLIARVASGADFDAFEAMKPMTKQTAGLAWAKAKEIDRLNERLKAACHAALDELGELELPSGMLLRTVLAEGNEQLDGRVVYQVLREMHGQELAEAAIEIDASKASITRALKAAAATGAIAPRSQAKVERVILQTIRDRGGAKKPLREKLVEIDPAVAQAPAVEGSAPPPAAPLPAPAPTESVGVAGEDRPGDEVVDLDAQEREWVRDQLEHALESDCDMADLHKRIMRGREKNIGPWSKLLLLWGKANEALKEREQKEAS